MKTFNIKLNAPDHCGNSPKSELIKNLTIAFAVYDLEFTKEYLDENIIWNLVGDKPIVGKTDFITALEKMSENKATELTIHSLITHGKEAAVYGDMFMMDGTKISFIDLYTFNSAGSTLVKEITTFLVHL